MAAGCGHKPAEPDGLFRAGYGAGSSIIDLRSAGTIRRCSYQKDITGIAGKGGIKR